MIELYHGNCFDFLEKLAGQRIVIITDPPYGKNLKNRSPGVRRRQASYKIVGDKSQTEGIRLARWAEQHGFPTVFFASPGLPWPGKWRSYLVWDKGESVGGGGDPQTCWKQSWELIQVARNGKLAGSRDGAVLHFPIGPHSAPYHPAQKPVSLMRYLIEKVATPDDIVFDPFMGSGSTGLAALASGRSFIGIEIEQAVYDVAVYRLDNAQGQLRAGTPANGQLSLLSLEEYDRTESVL